MFHYSVTYPTIVSMTAVLLGRLEFIRYIYECPELRHTCWTGEVIGCGDKHPHIRDYFHSQGLL